MTINEFKNKYGWDCTRADHLQIVIKDSIENHDHENQMATNYSMPIRQQIILHEQAIKLAQKNMEKETREAAKAEKIEAKEAAKAAKAEAKEAAKKKPEINMSAEEIEEKLQDIVVNFSAKNKLNQAALTIMGIKLSAKALMNADIQKLIPVGIEAYKRYTEGEDAEKILVDSFKACGFTEEELKKTVLDFWKDLKADKGMKDIVQLVEKFMKELDNAGLSIEAIYEVYKDALMEQLSPEDDKPEEVTEEEKPEVKQAAAAPESIIPEEVLDQDGKVVANVPAPVEQINPAQAETVTLTFKPEEYVANNEAFIKSYPKLKMFTKYAKDAGLWVIYEEVDGLISATLVEKDSNKLARVLKLDYKVIYGDTLRILTNNNKEGDLRKELFIPIENKILASKLIKGESLTKEERKEYYSKLPRVITDFRNPYSFVDRVDMSGLKISTEKWYQLVVNISTILTNNLIPMCRFKVDEYKSPEDFLLVVTDNAPVFKSGIMEESSHKFALADKIAIDYDTKLYANSNEAKVFDHKYRIGHVD